MIAGFTSAAALTIASGQWKSLLGVSIDPAHKSHTHAGVVDYYVDIFHNISTVRPQDAVLGLVCCVILLSLRVSVSVMMMTMMMMMRMMLVCIIIIINIKNTNFLRK